jgi:transposase
MSRRRKRDPGKEQFWRRMVQLWHAGKQTIRDFCTERDLSEANFHAWRRTIAQRDQASSKPNAHPNKRDTAKPRFVPIRVVSPTSASSTPLELVVGQGRVVRVPPGFDVATLRQLLDLLEEGPTC